MPARSQRPFVEELPRLMEERQLGLRQLALKAEVSAGHLSKLLRGIENRQPSIELLGRLAAALDLPVDYFVEYREAIAVEYLRTQPKLRDELYAKAMRSRRRGTSAARDTV